MPKATDKMRTVIAQYTHNYEFKVPRSLKLWPNEKVEECEYELCSDEDGVYYFSDGSELSPDVSPVGYWWIKWATLFYIDKDRLRQEIKGNDDDFSTKHADLIMEDSDEEETDEE